MIPRHAYLIEPVGNEYNNTKSIGGIELVINTTLEDAKFVNRVGVIRFVPEAYKTLGPKEGDLVVVHHNVFRTYLNIKGKKTKSNEYFRDGLYYVGDNRIYMYYSHKQWRPLSNTCFVKPVDTVQDSFLHRVEVNEENTGVLRYSNDFLTSIGINPGDRVGFTKNSEYEFEIEGEKVYRMRNEDICLTITEKQ